MKTDILKELEPLFEKAEKEKLWFYQKALSGPLWFSPQELKNHLKEGRYKWTGTIWNLRDPNEHLEEMLKEKGVESKAARIISAKYPDLDPKTLMRQAQRDKEARRGKQKMS
tara:strand:+ start:13158 stop:13493 length:336 start_codon:yes stop_codon:yes gene_type:complete